MSSKDVTAYLAKVPPAQRATLKALRSTLKALLPKAEECLSYGIPCFKLEGHAIAGYAAMKAHCSYFPHSGTVIPKLGELVADYSTNKGTLRFGVDEPLPKKLVAALVKTRLQEIAAGKR
jgi:uncharacterized protein YdhG (YjbR/CyaY superfamily)